ncbi:hypothetical protein [Microbulbifer sp. JMSA003]|uniref:hypothetical protein n=1 Tax=Microbulbifer sp. JMSA003 TaxID=3243369 RepID=UPI004039800A
MDRRYEKSINRYWEKMEARCREAFKKLDPNEWFDLWHTHPDWDGKGSSRPENRPRCDELTYRMLKLAESITEHRGNDVQCFALVKEDTMENSIYIHSDNPNGSEFPFQYEGVIWGYSKSRLGQVVDPESHEVGLFEGDTERTLFIRKKP